MREMRALLALDSESGEVGTKAIEIEMVKDVTTGKPMAEKITETNKKNPCQTIDFRCCMI